MESLSLCIVAGVVKTLLQLPIADCLSAQSVDGDKKWCNYDVTVSNRVNLCDPEI